MTERLNALRQFLDVEYRNGYSALPESWPHELDKRIDGAAIDATGHFIGATKDFARRVEAIERDETISDTVKRRKILAERVKALGEVERINRLYTDELQRMKEEKTRRQMVGEQDSDREAVAAIFEEAAYATPEENRARFVPLKMKIDPLLAYAWRRGTPALFGVSESDAADIERSLAYKRASQLDHSDAAAVEAADFFKARLEVHAKTAAGKIDALFGLYRPQRENAA